jgi:calcineurin-like phosphoesterase family protein
LGHESIAEMRGFSSSEAHDKVLLDGINSVITKRDKLFILGDVTMENAKHYHKLDSIRGYKHVILGNHDRHTNLPELLKHVDGACGCLKYKKLAMLSHIPIHPVEFDYRVSLNIHAHLHNKAISDPRYYNVDAARLGYVPVSWDNIVMDVAMETVEARVELSHRLTHAGGQVDFASLLMCPCGSRKGEQE